MQDEDSANDQINLSERLKSDEEKSATPSASPSRNSVFDFIYHDVRRVSSFLAQFQTFGTLGSTKSTSGTRSSSTDKKLGGGDFSVPGFAKGGASFERAGTNEINDGAEHTFDPLWRNALTLLGFLQEFELIERDVYKTRLGQFVLLEGGLVVLDPSLLEKSWERPAFKNQLRRAMGAQITKDQTGKQQDEMFKLFMEVLQIIPHSIQCSLVGSNFNCWSTLDKASLVGTSSDIILKNGALVAGSWSMLGIIDAFPDFVLLPDASGVKPNFDSIIQTMFDVPIPNIMASLAPLACMLAGRPKNWYGVTPLLIFREVNSTGVEQPKVD